MIFGMLFYDILFQHVDGAFETPYQAEPLDLRSDAFSIGEFISLRRSWTEPDLGSSSP